MTQNLIVFIIIGLAVVYATYATVKSLRGKNKNKQSSCNGCSEDCALKCNK